MNKFNFNDEKVKQLCQKHGLKLLILHGSHAKGTASPKSDIDVGILSGSKIDHKEYYKILGDFEEVFGDKFDPVFLNNAEPMISYHTAIHGIPLFESSFGTFNQFKVQCIARYQDTLKFRELEKKYIKSAVAKMGAQND